MPGLNTAIHAEPPPLPIQSRKLSMGHRVKPGGDAPPPPPPTFTTPAKPLEHVGIAMNVPVSTHPTPPYKHTPLFPLSKDDTPYRKIATEGVRIERVMGEDVVVVPREALRALSEAAFNDINHLLRPAHLASLKAIVEDPEATNNDKSVAFEFLKNANISAGGVLPMCQDTGTAIIMGKKGRLVWSGGDDEAALAEGARDAYLKRN